MLLLAEQLEFEQAARLRDQILALEQGEPSDGKRDGSRPNASQSAGSGRGKRARRR
jgi:excinuclease UvrABC nuclease subunit